MELMILGSGGSMPIPKALCQCDVCCQARQKGYPYKRTGPSMFVSDINLLIDTPPQIFESLNNCNIKKIDYLAYTHLDSDHFDGHSVLISLYFDGTKYCYKPKKAITFLVPKKTLQEIQKNTTQYGSLYDFYKNNGVIMERVIPESVTIDNIKITTIFMEGNKAKAYMYLLESKGKKVLYAPCDTKPFPFKSKHVYDVDLFITQPGYFEDGLRDDFVYPKDDYTRVELYSFNETLEIVKKIRSKKVLFVHLEEYWNRSYDDYKKLEKKNKNIIFAYDGMKIHI